MARQEINIGTNANDGTGDPLRTAFDKINDNLGEIYTNLGGDSLSNIGHTGNTIQSLDTNGNIVLSPNGTGTIEFPAVSFNDNNITGSRSNENLNISASGTGNVNVASAMTTIGQTVTGNITVTGNETITGDVTVTGNETITGNVTVTGATDVDNIKLDGNTISTTDTNGDLVLSPNGTGSVSMEAIRIRDNHVEATRSNDDLVLDTNGTGSVRIDSVNIKGSTIRTTDSTALDIEASSVNIDGNLTSTTTITAPSFIGEYYSGGQGGIKIENNIISTIHSNLDMQFQPNGTGTLDFSIPTQTTVGGVGAASKLPLDSANEVRPVGYLKIKVGGTEYVVPYFNAS